MTEAIAGARTMSRREALRRLAWIIAVVGSGAGHASRSESSPPSSATHGLSRLLGHPSIAASIGAAFISSHPEFGAIETVVSRLGLDLDALPAPGTTEVETVAKSIHARHIDDFRSDRLIAHAGYMLSNTELCLAALAHLTRPARGIRKSPSS